MRQLRLLGSSISFLLLVACGQQNDLIVITDWGPQEAVAGKSFNPQPDGSSAIWFKYRGLSDANMVNVWFGNNNLGHPTLSSEFGSFVVPNKLTGKQGEYEVYLTVRPSDERIDMGFLRLD